MDKQRKATSTRKPPEPSESHADIDDWMNRMMPDLQPISARLDELIRAELPKLQYAIKWKKAYYGLPERGWVIEMVAYDVSLNVVFLGGADFDSPPPLGDGDRSQPYDDVGVVWSVCRAPTELAGCTPSWTPRPVSTCDFATRGKLDAAATFGVGDPGTPPVRGKGSAHLVNDALHFSSPA